MKKIIVFVVLATALAAPSLASAAAYHYINLYGEVETIEAPTATVALQIANASGDVLHSGVGKDQGILNEGDSYAVIYSYVDIAGNVKTIQAASKDAAYLIATDRAPTSGLLVVGLDE